MNLNVYIDAFNLYYGCLKDSPYRWLNLRRLCELSLPNDTIMQIKYFTADVKARPHNPDQPLREKLYLRALKTLPDFHIIKGSFQTTEQTMHLVDPLPDGMATVKVFKTEEKGSDVNLASHLLHDGHLGKYEGAVVISNDSDLVEPIKLVRRHLRLNVGVLNPHLSKTSSPSVQLKNCAWFFRYIRKTDLADSQFPDELVDSRGKFSKAPIW